MKTLKDSVQSANRLNRASDLSFSSPSLPSRLVPTLYPSLFFTGGRDSASRPPALPPIKAVIRSVDRIRFTVWVQVEETEETKDIRAKVLKVIKEGLDRFMVRAGATGESRRTTKGGKLKMVYKAIPSHRPDLFDNKREPAKNPALAGPLVTVLLEDHGWIRVDLVRPDEALQRSIRALMLKVSFMADTYISEVEWAYDFFPADRRNLIRLRRALTHGLVIPFAKRKAAEKTFTRIGAEDLIGPTDVWASGGDKRHQSGRGAEKGITCYDKPQEGPYFVRVELLANRPLLRDLKIGIKSLPIKPEAVNILDHIAFRRGIENDGLWKLINAIAKKKWGLDWAKGDWNMAKKARFRALHHRLETELNPEEHPVAYQMDRVKAEINRHGLSTNLTDKLFPKIDAPSAYRGIETGEIKGDS